ncbi:MAG TPA: VapC toxin family PIN domain ribonuclease [Candidatus Jacksonbacteria bacterium]|nr:MAG: hypothetical protein UV19_C0005G0020 [Parcubacteria group bacterium GW2011_GWA2_42_28]KKT55148.1 MAG: hypothetical protein UW45_C0009G0020 [Parcubacteria group bacterium GW2011_GWC2_44_22]HBH46088.1 VapC toxin family PIN domain ribonuclease [Candidatus Jacksonbacteria bacterium]HCC49952.1 VapC toxin family PIN domain ribonuclease [Candidatus Jacksonbacteria bacterium]HCE48813.1 VapC toxin family PIN domain ribonuclease [Candidatus Jacksonbacteria bacterium]
MAITGGGKIYLVDTDMLINHLRKFCNLFDVLSPLAVNSAVFMVSVISKAEVFAGRSSKIVKQQIKINALFNFFTLVPVTADIAELAGKYTRDFEVPLLDALIAATTVINQAMLITQNTRHFSKIPNLKLISSVL